MKIGCWEKRYVYPMGDMWVKEVTSFEKMPDGVGIFCEDDEMSYFGVGGKRLWVVRKGEVR